MNDQVRVRAPATTANLGPGFDCAAAALDLWNEVTVTEGGEPDLEHLGVRAFALLADPNGLEFAFTAAHAALLGAAIALQDPELFVAALQDELHEPYRAPNAPVLNDVRAELPAGAVGATLSGSGPTVIVWAHEAQVEACVLELAQRFPDTSVRPLAVSGEGAGAF